MAKSTRESEFQVLFIGPFQQVPCWDKDVMSNVCFVLSNNSKDQLGDLNKKLITAINTLDGCTLEEISNHDPPRRLYVHSAYSSWSC